MQAQQADPTTTNSPGGQPITMEPPPQPHHKTGYSAQAESSGISYQVNPLILSRTSWLSTKEDKWEWPHVLLRWSDLPPPTPPATPVRQGTPQRNLIPISRGVYLAGGLQWKFSNTQKNQDISLDTNLCRSLVIILLSPQSENMWANLVTA